MNYDHVNKLAALIDDTRIKYKEETKDDTLMRERCDVLFTLCDDFMIQVGAMAAGVEQHRGTCNGLRVGQEGISAVKERYKQQALKGDLAKEEWTKILEICEEHRKILVDMYHAQREAFVQHAGRLEGLKKAIFKHVEHVEKMLANKRRKEATPEIPEDKMDRMEGKQRLPGMESPIDTRLRKEAGQSPAKTKMRRVKKAKTPKP